jgi:formylglycine-generating enzyme required for sulfatase activity
MLIFALVVFTGAGALGAVQKPAKKYTETITAKNGDEISFDMVLIPKGKFVMGSPADEANRKEDEGPQHEVQLDAFYLCTTETTIELFLAYYQETSTAKKGLEAMEEAKIKEAEAKAKGIDAVTGPTPVYGDMTMGYGKEHPAIGMTWHNAMTFCRWLSIKTGKKYRLPTEAEWEYACRAGTTGTYGCVSDPKKIGEYAVYIDNADGETSDVGKKKPNAWGLYDMAGNVCEWVHDFYSETAYAEAAKDKPAVNPKGPKEGDVHVARGGDHTSPVEGLRCAARTFEEPWWRSGDPQFPKSIWWLPEMDFIGVRVACSVDKPDKK